MTTRAHSVGKGLSNVLSPVVAATYRLGAARPAGPLGQRCVARDVRAGTDLLLTTLRIDLSRLSPADRALLVKRARSEATHYHPHLARQHAVGIEGDARLWLVQDLPTGELLPPGVRLAPWRAAALAAHVAEALGYLHDAGTTHGAVCRETIFVDRAGTPLLVDLGLGRAADMCGSLGRLLGHMAAPEVAQGVLATAATDTYALGLFLLELLTGPGPTGEEQAQAGMAARLAHVFAVVESPVLWQLLQKALEPDPAQRFQTATHMLRPLREAAEELQMRAASAPPPASVSAPTARTAQQGIQDTRREVGARAREAAQAPAPLGLAGGVAALTWVVVKNLLSLAVALVLVGAAVVAGFAIAFREAPADVQVPDLPGMTVAEATKLAKARGLELKVVTRTHHETALPNTVISTSPYAGKWVKQGRTIDTTVSLGRQEVPVPKVVGLQLGEAQGELEAKGLRTGLITEQAGTGELQGQVIRQRPSEGTVVEAQSKVDLVVSAGPSGGTARDRRRYAATVSVRLPFGAGKRQVRIELVTVTGQKTVVYQADHFGGDQVERYVENRGPATVKVYVDGDERESTPLQPAEPEQD